MSTMLEASLTQGSEAAVNFAPIIFGIVAVLGLIGALKGLSRGISRQLVRTITVVAAAVISFFVATGVYTAISDFLADKTMADIEAILVQNGILSSEADNSWLQNIDTATVLLVATVPLSLIIMPLTFVICFIMISGVLLIVHAILCAIFGFRKRGNNLLSRLMGMALGLVQGVAVAGLLLMPVIGISTTVSETVTSLEESAPEDETTAQVVGFYNDYVKSIAENPASDILGKCGANKLYRTIATVKIDGQKTDMTTLLPDITVLAGKITALKGVDMMHLTPENEAAITDLFDAVEKNAYLTNVLAGGVKTFSYMYTNGVVSLETEAPIATLLNSAMSIFHTSDSTNIHQDIDTVCEVVFILSRDGVLASFETGSSDMLGAFTKRDENGVTTVNKVMDTINKNERTKPLVKMITELSISVMSQSAGLDEGAVETRDNLKANLNDKTMKIKKADYATEEEYVSAVSDSLDESLKENNITLEKEVVDNMAQYIADNYSDKDELTDDETNDIIIHYYDAYLEYTDAQNQN